MKLIIIFIIITMYCLGLKAQTLHLDFGTCFGRADKKSIQKKMDNFMIRVSEEMGCPKDKLSYKVDEYYTVFYSRQCRHLPKRITFNGCGVTRTYKNNSFSGAILYWLLGSWSLDQKI